MCAMLASRAFARSRRSNIMLKSSKVLTRAAQGPHRSSNPFEVQFGRAVAAPRWRIGMAGDAELVDGDLHRNDGELQRCGNQPRRQHAAAVMMMRDRAVIVPLGQPIVRMEPVGRRIVIVRVLRRIVVMRVRRYVVIVRMPGIGRERRLMHKRGFVVRMIGHMRDFDLQVMAMVEDRARKRRRSMFDLEDMLHPVEHDDRHLDRQRHAQPHAKHGDVPFGDCESLADHDSSRSGSGPPTIGQPTSRRQVGTTPQQGYRFQGSP
jgi:hypothetical protein